MSQAWVLSKMRGKDRITTCSECGKGLVTGVTTSPRQFSMRGKCYECGVPKQTASEIEASKKEQPTENSTQTLSVNNSPKKGVNVPLRKLPDQEKNEAIKIENKSGVQENSQNSRKKSIATPKVCSICSVELVVGINTSSRQMKQKTKNPRCSDCIKSTLTPAEKSPKEAPRKNPPLKAKEEILKNDEKVVDINFQLKENKKKEIEEAKNKVKEETEKLETSRKNLEDKRKIEDELRLQLEEEIKKEQEEEEKKILKNSIPAEIVQQEVKPVETPVSVNTVESPPLSLVKSELSPRKINRPISPGRITLRSTAPISPRSTAPISPRSTTPISPRNSSQPANGRITVLSNSPKKTLHRPENPIKDIPSKQNSNKLEGAVQKPVNPPQISNSSTKIPAWKLAQMEREKREAERIELERLKKQEKLTSIARRVSVSDSNPSIGCHTFVNSLKSGSNK